MDWTIITPKEAIALKTKIFNQNSEDLKCGNVNVTVYNPDMSVNCEKTLPAREVMRLLGKNVSSAEYTAKNLCKDFKNLKMVIITRGEKGAFVYDSVYQKSYECDAEKVNVVSTVGAGDSFSASFLAEYLKTGDIMCALNFATKISGYVVSQKDAVPEYDIEE